MTNSEKNFQFIFRVSLQMKNEILENIAKHYGITHDEVLNEILDDDAENIMDYITGPNRAAFHLIYKNTLKNI